MGTIESPNDGAPGRAPGGADGTREAAAGPARAGAPGAPPEPVAVVVAARDEGERIEATLGALARAFPSAALFLADDGSRDDTPRLAAATGATVAGTGRPLGKGEAVTAAARRALAGAPRGTRDVFLLCDGDLGDSAAELGPLVAAVAAEECEVAVAEFTRRVGGGFGIALSFARWAIRRGCGLSTRAPISGQRALDRATLESVLPLAHGFGMEVGMTIDAVRAGARVREIPLALSHRATGRTAAGFAHRGRQLLDFARAYARARAKARRV